MENSGISWKGENGVLRKVDGWSLRKAGAGAVSRVFLVLEKFQEKTKGVF